MFPDASFNSYLTQLMAQNADHEEVVDVPRDYPDHIRAGNDYAALIAQPGWKRLLDDLELRANRALNNLRNSHTNNTIIIKSLRDRWVEAEDSLKYIQIVAGEAIERRRTILAELQDRFSGLGPGPDGDGDAETGTDFDHNGFDITDDSPALHDFVNGRNNGQPTNKESI